MPISMSPPVGTLPFVVIVTSVFFAAIVPTIAISTVWPFCVQVPATSILPFATSFFDQVHWPPPLARSEEHTSELQSLMRISYAVFCLKKKNEKQTTQRYTHIKNTHKFITINYTDYTHNNNKPHDSIYCY